ncbi:MAG: hypothetical protein QOE11_2586 [Solirubrobacteraceae bacterium]|jgi:diguanylate cyclase (GGDEF)-like protein|nr:hypothetical protein [Solirubrobacteraceae bacterium]
MRMIRPSRRPRSPDAEPVADDAGAHELAQARADRDALARELALAQIDPLTGARTRAAGLRDLERDMSRCRRTGARLVVAYLDVVGLKRINDSEGHAAGDELLKRIVRLVTDQLRPYDLVVRLGGDEFLCAMSDMTLLEARRRFAHVAATLAMAADPGAIRTGFAQLRPEESSTELIARADSELVEGRSGRTSALVSTGHAAVRPDPGEHAPGAALSLAIPGGLRAPGRVRAALEALAPDISPDELARLQLLIGELVTNSVVHGGAGSTARIMIQATIRAHTVHGEVSDTSLGVRPASRPSLPGYDVVGLAIIERSAERWGTSHDGRRVWFELDRPGDDAVAERVVMQTASQAPNAPLAARRSPS